MIKGKLLLLKPSLEHQKWNSDLALICREWVASLEDSHWKLAHV
ncbi:hypothetical protein AVEN_103773-1, partial [Araneus ventricosus]